MASNENPVEYIREDAPTNRPGTVHSATWTAVLIALAMAILVAATTIHDITSRGPHGAVDWIRICLSVALVGVLTTLSLMRKQFAGTRAEDSVGEASIALFELDFDTFGANGQATRGASSRRKVSIGAIARSIRQHAADISDIATRLANAYSADSGEQGSDQGRMRRITEAQASALAQLDQIRREAEHTNVEIGGYRERLAALESLSRLQVDQITQHASQLQTIAVDASSLSRAAGTLQAIHEAAIQTKLESNRQATDMVSGLRQIIDEMETALLTFRATVNASGLAGSPDGSAPETSPADFTEQAPQETAASLVEAINAMARKSEALEKLLSAVADAVKLLQVNLNFAATTGSKGMGPHAIAYGPRATEQEAAILTEAASTLAAARDIAATIGHAISRSIKTTQRTFDVLEKREQKWREAIQSASAENATLSGIAGEMARTIGEVRFATLTMMNSLSSASKNMNVHLVNTENVAMMQQINEAIENTISSSQRIAIGAVHLASSAEMINRSAIRAQGGTQELRMLASNAAGNGQRLQHATSTAASKVEGLVGLTRGLVRKEDGAARRATANESRFTIEKKTQLIDEFALRVLAMEESARMSKGPSPAIDRDEQSTKVPQFELPLQ